MEYAQKKLPGNRTLDNYAIFGKIVLPPMETKISLTRWVKIVSCIFILLTIIVYAILPKLRNLFGKILLSYCVAMFMLFFVLTITQFFQQDFSNSFCKFVGFSLIFFSFCSFTWMHIICIDIWYSFGSPRTISGPLQRNEMKKLLLYSVYGWGFPMLWVLLILFFNDTKLLPKSIQPYVGYDECYFENYDNRKGNYAFSIFITLPLILQQIVNIVLFIRTVRHCIRVKSEIRRMDDNNRSRNDYQAGKEKLYLVLKLGVVMGMLFLFETISAIRKMDVNPITEHIEIVWDTINCLQGLFIFIIFICKKKIYISLCEKWKMVRGYSPTSTTTPGSIQSTCTNEETLNLEEKTWTSTQY
ncbi:hypothetical protein WA026_015285 [Henosepilachna vigintioctopunctata]|uniref:G-protein coupled receptors family 2 profile 2 domain-containing protein n=1 Tax=Henosepilachna vigintioctopunctata TaxID=420089 RepID=A0AAW1TNY4_9CUCU